ncbi:hypothetical protein H2136_05145 [Aeromonas hydrophila]|uniref:DNA helicase DnaB-like N-terminal domain-containing protein n=1 Tax=Aeromonas hydrophila TaxID=644 RepID=A0A926FJK6_AERHY|nr:hypothetical protein [Aeromonas hydrophila]
MYGRASDGEKRRQDTTAESTSPLFEAEQSVLGGLMLDNEAWDRVAERVIDRISTAAHIG